MNATTRWRQPAHSTGSGRTHWWCAGSDAQQSPSRHRGRSRL